MFLEAKDVPLPLSLLSQRDSRKPSGGSWGYVDTHTITYTVKIAHHRSSSQSNLTVRESNNPKKEKKTHNIYISRWNKAGYLHHTGNKAWFQSFYRPLETHRFHFPNGYHWHVMEPVSYNKKQLMCSGASVLLAVIEKKNLAQQGRTLVRDSLSTQKLESLQRQQIRNTCKQSQ